MYSTFSPLLFQHFTKFPTRLFFKLFYSLSVEGLENIESCKKAGIILASNHVSDWDPVLISATLPVLSPHMPLFFVSREKEFYKDDAGDPLGWIKQFIYGGSFFRLMGAYPATGGIKNYEKSLTHHLGLLGEDKTVCIFPAGKGMSREMTLQNTKGGVGFLAHTTKRLVVPVAIRKGKTLGGSRVYVTVAFGAPLEYKDIFKDDESPTVENYKKGAVAIMTAVEDLVG